MQPIKNILAKLICLLFFINGLNLFAHTLQTPRGSQVEHEHPSDGPWYGCPPGYPCDTYSASWWTDWSDWYYSILYEERLERANKAYNCHAYAWAGSRQSQQSTWCWIGNDEDPPYQDENIYWTDGSYDQVSGSVATYANYGDYKDHSLELTGNMIEGQYEVRSKWSRLPLYRHKLYSDPYGAYPSDTKFYRGSVDVPDDYSTIQAAINAAAGQTINVSADDYNENIIIGSNIVVYGAGRNNTTIIGTADVDGYLSRLHGFTVTGLISSFSGDAQTIDFVTAQNGIELDYGGGKYITSVIVTGNSTSAIDAFQTDTYIDGLGAITSGNTNGVYARQYADVVLDGYQIENKERGVYLYNRADAYINDLEFCDNTYDIYAGYASYAEAEGFWLVFSGDPEDVTYGDVDYPEEWDECDGFKKAIVASAPDAPDPAAQTGNADDPGVSDYRKALASLHAIKRNLMADLKADITPDPRNYQSDYEAAIDQFKQVVAQYPGTPSSLKAIARVSSCNFSLDRPEAVYGYVNSVAKSPEFSAVKHEVLRFLIPYHVNQKDYDQALQLSDELLENSTDEDFACGILLGKGIIHRDGRHDLASAAEVFRRIIANYPDNPTALDAQDQLARIGESVPGGAPVEPETVEALALEGYPNPFNPTATIRFGLPEAGKVTLVVYDLMGREVVRLLEGHQDAGWQAVVWDGRDAKGKEVPTGIYIARLVTPQNTKAIKLVMMK